MLVKTSNPNPVGENALHKLYPSSDTVESASTLLGMMMHVQKSFSSSGKKLVCVFPHLWPSIRYCLELPSHCYCRSICPLLVYYSSQKMHLWSAGENQRTLEDGSFQSVIYVRLWGTVITSGQICYGIPTYFRDWEAIQRVFSEQMIRELLIIGMIIYIRGV